MRQEEKGKVNRHSALPDLTVGATSTQRRNGVPFYATPLRYSAMLLRYATPLRYSATLLRYATPLRYSATLLRYAT